MSGLGSSFRRLYGAFEERPEDGLINRRRRAVSASAADEAEAAWVVDMFRPLSFVFRIKHFHELIVGLPMASGKPRWLYQGRRQRQLDATDRHAIFGASPFHEPLHTFHIPLNEGASLEWWK